MSQLSRRHDDGATAAEYAILVSAIAAVIVAVVIGLGAVVAGMYGSTSTCVATKGVSSCP